VISGQKDLQKAYQDEKVAREYVTRRFESDLGALLHTRQVAAVRRVIDEYRVVSAVEIAPGPARVSVDVLPALRSATLVDASAQMLAEARRRLAAHGVRTPVQFLQADAFSLPLRDTCELVYSFRLIRHFQRADRIRLYQQIHSILKPGGRLVFDAVNVVVSEPLRATAGGDEYQHFDALVTPAEVTDELREAGFDSLMHKAQIYVSPRSSRLSRLLMEALDRTGGEPLEWVVTCRRV
jgi:ubiquinone/menaquinone biosynthesis C-methylase UbiE